jgi:hypothetical protein
MASLHQSHRRPGRHLPSRLRRHWYRRTYSVAPTLLAPEIHRQPIPQWALDFNDAIDAAHARGDDAEVNRLLRDKYRQVLECQRRLVA